MEQIAKKLTQYFLAHGLIKEDDAEVCQYALYRRISRAVGLIALTLLGGLITDFGSAFCFTVSFLFLRERTGGYHAKTEWQCALYSAAMIFATMFALPIFAEEPNNYWAIMIASSALIWVSSPADNKQIHLSRAESKAMAKHVCGYCFWALFRLPCWASMVTFSPAPLRWRSFRSRFPL